MNIKEKIDQVTQEKEELNKKMLSLKNEYEQHITNKEIPLMERWEFYLNAPAELKNKKTSLIRPKTGFLTHVKENWFDAPECYGRGKPIYIDSLFEDLVYEGKIYLENFDLNKFDEEDIELALEELLEMNLEYFTFDW